MRRHGSHRLVGVRFDEWAVVSGEALEFTEKLAHGVSKWFLGGDLNWRQVYANSFRENEVLCSMRQATTVMNTFPDRVVSKNIKVEHLIFEVIPGIPTHLLLEFSASMEPPERRVTSERRKNFSMTESKGVISSLQAKLKSRKAARHHQDQWRLSRRGEEATR